MQLRKICLSLCYLALSPLACASDLAHTDALAPALDVPGVRLRGRFDQSDPAGPRFAWPNSAMAAHFRGTQVSLELGETAGAAQGAATHTLYDVLVDHQAPKVLTAQPNVTRYPLAAGLDLGEHTVWVVKRTESNVGTGQFLGFDVGADGTLLSPPVVPERHVEFIGDGEFTGYGATASVNGSDMCPFSAPTENADASIPKLTADQLDADFMNLADSNKGVLQNTDPQDVDTMPMVYARSLPADSHSAWSFGGWSANVVVLDIGRNDLSGDSGSGTLQNWDGFVQAYASLVRTARQNYPGAAILCSVGAGAHGDDRQTLLDAIGEAVDGLQKAGDERVWLFDYFAGDPKYHSYDDVASGEGLGWGCDYHPSAAGAQFLAQRLSAAIKTHANW